jgi:Cu-Zn family superoxide dismutase
MHKKIKPMVYMLMFTLVLSSCGTKATKATIGQRAAADSNVINVNLINDKGAKIGTARLTQLTEGVQFHVEAAKLAPGIHGIHVHEFGMCDTPDFKSAGAHLNPQNKQHGFHNPQGYHAGDLPNIEVDANGKVNTDIVTKTMTLEKGKSNSLLKPDGASLIIHEKADDYMTDPSGNSGNRVACAVIK